MTGQAASLEKRKKRRGATSGKIKYRNVQMLMEVRVEKRGLNRAEINTFLEKSVDT